MEITTLQAISYIDKLYTETKLIDSYKQEYSHLKEKEQFYLKALQKDPSTQFTIELNCTKQRKKHVEQIIKQKQSQIEEIPPVFLGFIPFLKNATFHYWIEQYGEKDKFQQTWNIDSFDESFQLFADCLQELYRSYAIYYQTQFAIDISDSQKEQAKENWKQQATHILEDFLFKYENTKNITLDMER